jgi:hypothetical protein
MTQDQQIFCNRQSMADMNEIVRIARQGRVAARHLNYRLLTILLPLVMTVTTLFQRITGASTQFCTGAYRLCAYAHRR